METGLYSPLCDEDRPRTYSLLVSVSHEHQERISGFSQAWWEGVGQLSFICFRWWSRWGGGGGAACVLPLDTKADLKVQEH